MHVIFSLGHKLTLGLLLVLMIGAITSGSALWLQLETMSENAVSQNVLTILNDMNAVRRYTSDQINPLLEPIMRAEGTFIPQSVPAFTARTVAELLHAQAGSKDMSYREVGLNPTNPSNLADEFETELLLRFRNEPATKTISGYKDSNGEKLWYTALPMAVTSEKCLVCHSTPEAAPPGMVKLYGTEHGFGWKLNEIIAVQIGYVPASTVFTQRLRTWFSTMTIGILSLVMGVLAISVLARRDVVRPIVRMAALAQHITDDELDEYDPDVLSDVARRGDELGQLATVLRRMWREISAREQALKQQVRELRIEVDNAKNALEVAAITETDFFHDLQAKAKELRTDRRLRQELERTPRVDSVTSIDALDLPEPMHKAVSKAFHQGSLLSSELAADLDVSLAEARQLGQVLVDKGFLKSSEREADGEIIYSVNLATRP